MPDFPIPHPRFSLLGIIGGLMSAENLGDVHDEINLLCDLAGIRRPEGGFEEGWSKADRERLRCGDA